MRWQGATHTRTDPRPRPRTIGRHAMSRIASRRHHRPGGSRPQTSAGRPAVRPGTLTALTAAGLLALAACGTGTGSGGSGGDSGTLTEIDYYDAAPQNTQLPQILDECAARTG